MLLYRTKMWILLIITTICLFKGWNNVAYLFGTKGEELMIKVERVASPLSEPPNRV